MSKQSQLRRAAAINEVFTIAQNNPNASTNDIQRALKERGLGLRRQDIQTVIREARNAPKKQDTQKYTPKKYKQGGIQKPSGSGRGVAHYGKDTPDGSILMYGVPVEYPELGEQPFRATDA